MHNLRQLTHYIYHKTQSLKSNSCQLNPIHGFAPTPLYHIHLSDLQLTSEASCLTCSLSSLSLFVTNTVTVLTCSLSSLSLSSSQMLSQYSLALLSLPSSQILSQYSHVQFALRYVRPRGCTKKFPICSDGACPSLQLAATLSPQQAKHRKHTVIKPRSEWNPYPVCLQ